MAPTSSPRRVGRYELLGEIASGGMATVYYGRLVGPFGFQRVVAVKRLHPHLAREREFVTMFVDEVRLAARVRHPNVVSTLDVVYADAEAFLVMEHVLGESLSRLVRAARNHDAPIPARVAAAILAGTLHGLHAAHEATGPAGEPLHIVHRDVSPQNILVGTDGVPRLIDFGVAKAAGRLQTTGDGSIKGKIAYMAPEQLLAEEVDRRTDVYAAGVVLWELLAGRRMVDAPEAGAAVHQVLEQEAVPPSSVAPSVPKDLDAVVIRALAREPSRRFGSARQMAAAIEAATRLAGPIEVGEWLRGLSGHVVDERARLLAEIESREAAPYDAAVVRTWGTVRRGRTWVAVLGAIGAASALALAMRRAPTAAAPDVAPVTVLPVPAPAVSPSPPLDNLADARLVPSPPPPPAAPTSSAPSRAAHSAPSLPSRKASPRADAGCKVEQTTDSAGLLHFRCAP